MLSGKDREVIRHNLNEMMLLGFTQEDSIRVVTAYAQLEETPVEYSVRAPKGGVAIGAKEFVGGEFIPSSDMRNATPGEKAKIEGKAIPDHLQMHLAQHVEENMRVPLSVNRQDARGTLERKKNIHEMAQKLASQGRKEQSALRKSRPERLKSARSGRDIDDLKDEDVADRLVKEWNKHHIGEQHQMLGGGKGAAVSFFGSMLGAVIGNQLGKPPGQKGISVVGSLLGAGVGAGAAQIGVQSSMQLYRFLTETRPEAAQAAREEMKRKGIKPGPSLLQKAGQGVSTASGKAKAGAKAAKGWFVRNKKPIAKVAAALIVAGIGAAAVRHGYKVHQINRQKPKEVKPGVWDVSRVPGVIEMNKRLEEEGRQRDADSQRSKSEYDNYLKTIQTQREPNPSRETFKINDVVDTMNDLRNSDMRPEIDRMSWLSQIAKDPKLTPAEKQEIKTEINKHYRNLAKAFHPDRNPGDKKAAERMAKLGAVKDALTNFQEILKAIGYANVEDFIAYFDESEKRAKDGKWEASGSAETPKPARKPGWLRRNRKPLAIGAAAILATAGGIALHHGVKQMMANREKEKNLEADRQGESPITIRDREKKIAKLFTGWHGIAGKIHQGNQLAVHPVEPVSPPDPAAIANDALGGLAQIKRKRMKIRGDMNRSRWAAQEAEKRGDWEEERRHTDEEKAHEQKLLETTREVRRIHQKFSADMKPHAGKPGEPDAIRSVSSSVTDALEFRSVDTPVVYVGEDGGVYEYTHDVTEEARDDSGEWTAGGGSQKKSSGKMNKEELDALEAEQRKNLPAWWDKESRKAPGPKPKTPKTPEDMEAGLEAKDKRYWKKKRKKAATPVQDISDDFDHLQGMDLDKPKGQKKFAEDAPDAVSNTVDHVADLAYRETVGKLETKAAGMVVDKAKDMAGAFAKKSRDSYDDLRDYLDRTLGKKGKKAAGVSTTLATSIVGQASKSALMGSSAGAAEVAASSTAASTAVSGSMAVIGTGSAALANEAMLGASLATPVAVSSGPPGWVVGLGVAAVAAAAYCGYHAARVGAKAAADAGTKFDKDEAVRKAHARDGKAIVRDSILHGKTVAMVIAGTKAGSISWLKNTTAPGLVGQILGMWQEDAEVVQ